MSSNVSLSTDSILCIADFHRYYSLAKELFEKNRLEELDVLINDIRKAVDMKLKTSGGFREQKQNIQFGYYIGLLESLAEASRKKQKEQNVVNVFRTNNYYKDLNARTVIEFVSKHPGVDLEEVINQTKINKETICCIVARLVECQVFSIIHPHKSFFVSLTPFGTEFLHERWFF